jgi:hypothetical protein
MGQDGGGNEGELLSLEEIFKSIAQDSEDGRIVEGG